MHDDVSGDIDLYGANDSSANGVSGVAGLSSVRADERDVSYGGETVLGNSATVGNSVVDWSTGVAHSVVAYCRFWPVDPWGRWGVELSCNQATPCYDNVGATSDNPAADDKSARVTNKAIFTVPAHKLALVHLTLNDLGRQLLTTADGQLSGKVVIYTNKTQQKPTVLSGERTFHIYYLRCTVWGNAQPVADSIEAKLADSPIGRAYGTRGLSRLVSAGKGCA